MTRKVMAIFFCVLGVISLTSCGSGYDEGDGNAQVDVKTGIVGIWELTQVKGWVVVGGEANSVEPVYVDWDIDKRNTVNGASIDFPYQIIDVAASTYIVYTRKKGDKGWTLAFGPNTYSVSDSNVTFVDMEDFEDEWTVKSITYTTLVIETTQTDLKGTGKTVELTYKHMI